MNQLETARAAIDKMFSDTSVSVDETISRLRDLRDHINILMNSLD